MRAVFRDDIMAFSGIIVGDAANLFAWRDLAEQTRQD